MYYAYFFIGISDNYPPYKWTISFYTYKHKVDITFILVESIMDERRDILIDWLIDILVLYQSPQFIWRVYLLHGIRKNHYQTTSGGYAGGGVQFRKLIFLLNLHQKELWANSQSFKTQKKGINIYFYTSIAKIRCPLKLGGGYSFMVFVGWLTFVMSSRRPLRRFTITISLLGRPPNGTMYPIP